MTREEAKELLPIIQAFAEDKEIEYRSKGFDEEWRRLIQIPGLSYDSFEYRIKPESKSRPFKDADECWQEMLKHQPFGWVKDKEGVAYTTITEVTNGDDNTAINGVCDWCLEEIYENFTFADGAPFGAKEGA